MTPDPALSLVAVSSGDSATSKTRVLATAALELAGGGRLIDLIDLPADALLGRRPDDGADDAVAAASAASVLVLATPIYRATYNGTMKAFLDRFGPDALSRTAVVWVGTAAAAGHFLALDTGGRAVVASLKGWTVPTVVYATGADFTDGRPSAAVLETLQMALDEARSLATRRWPRYRDADAPLSRRRRWSGLRARAYPARKLSRTCRTGLSPLVSTSTTLCQVPSWGLPSRTGTDSEGLTSAGSTWSAPCPGAPCRWPYRSSRGSSRWRASSRSRSDPEPTSIRASPAVAWGAKTWTSPSPARTQNLATEPVRSITVRPPVSTESRVESMAHHRARRWRGPGRTGGRTPVSGRTRGARPEVP